MKREHRLASVEGLASGVVAELNGDYAEGGAVHPVLQCRESRLRKAIAVIRGS